MNKFSRSSGILLHPTALPGPYGIGTLGRNAYAFMDWLELAGQRYWQICPLGPTGYGDSPYQSFGAFAGNPNLIDLDNLVELGLLAKEDILPFHKLPEGNVDFGRLIPLKTAVLNSAWQNFTNNEDEVLARDFSQFRESAADWLDDFTLFVAIKEAHAGQSWDKWPDPLRLRRSPALESAGQKWAEDINRHAFIQFLFHRQWSALKTYANEHGIRIIGDIPIFVAFDSADCWAMPELFRLDENRRPTHVAGVPPDYFSATGQLWGNPLYDWTAMEKNGFAWWLSLLGHNLNRFDALRIDHFRGFAACWSVPFGEETAVNGEWIPTPGMALFHRIRDVFNDPPIIAEDLGVITDDVKAIMNEFGFPGMKILQFAFDTSDGNGYLPHNFPRNCLVYTGTHDNNTSAGWFNAAADHVKEYVCAYLNLPKEASGADVARALIRAAIASVSDLAVLPWQDVLGLGNEARFNTPGIPGGNWTWRTEEQVFTEELAGELKKICRVYGRG